MTDTRVQSLDAGRDHRRLEHSPGRGIASYKSESVDRLREGGCEFFLDKMEDLR